MCMIESVIYEPDCFFFLFCNFKNAKSFRLVTQVEMLKKIIASIIKISDFSGKFMEIASKLQLKLSIGCVFDDWLIKNDFRRRAFRVKSSNMWDNVLITIVVTSDFTEELKRGERKTKQERSIHWTTKCVLASEQGEGNENINGNNSNERISWGKITQFIFAKLFFFFFFIYHLFTIFPNSLHLSLIS